ncbi:MAG: BatA domain-containing protein [candidate division KSB1 bacterium]|nr:BatA domain-containing protein [candidate division KSB1 bacterium]MDZ7364450.1 BatA domain-containing protein [candidate division KSB1 bacterium]MDZ7402822.1 BatA domain-containing protein [candidate division KSB1 bacterium]
MFGFLTAPYLLLGLGAALLPVLIHLIRRNKPETVHFAAMRFLDSTPLRLLRYQKLKHLLLLLLRILALLLLGLAFARPYLTGDKVPRLLGGEPRAIAIIVDVSASMAAADHFATAREEARRLLQQASSNDRVWLIGAANIAELLAENAEPQQAEAALAQLRQRQTAGNLRETLLFADQLLDRSPLQRRAIYLISDLQASNLPAGNFTFNSNAEFEPMAVKPAWQNVAVLDGQMVESTQEVSAGSAASPPRARQDDRVTAYACRVRNFSDSDQRLEVQLFNQATPAVPLATRSLSLAARTEQVIQFAAANLKNVGREQTVYFEIKAPVDDLPADNRFYLVAEAERKRRVLILRGSAESTYFVREALGLQRSLYQLHEATPNTLSQYRLEDFDAVLVAGVAGFNRGEAAALQQYVEQGGGLILTLAATLQSEMYNRFLAEILPGKISVPVRATGRAPQAGLALTEIDFGHPIFKIFVDPSNGDPTKIHVSQYYRLEAVPQAIRLAGFEDGAPALLERGAGKGKVLLWVSSLDLKGGNLPVRGIFVPLLYQWLNYVCRPDPPQTTTVAGQTLFLDEAIQPARALTVTFPDGAQREFEKLQPPVLKETAQTGFYRVQQNQRVFWHAVNLEARESDPASVSAENFAARVIRPDEHALAQNSVAGIFGAPEASQRDTEKQQKLWRLGLWALLILLMTEVWLANRTPR